MKMAILNKALNSIQNGKAAGDDRIYIEMFKYSNCDPLKDEIFKLVHKIREIRYVPKLLQYIRSSIPLNVWNIITKREKKTLSK